MWSAILSFGGWVVFWLLLFFYVRWTGLEREFFSGQDPENWKPGLLGETSAPRNEQSKRLERLARIASLWRPA